jgi:hypothetical protein
VIQFFISKKQKRRIKIQKQGRLKMEMRKTRRRRKKIIKEKKKSEGVKDEFKYSHLWLAIYSHMSLPHLKQ